MAKTTAALLAGAACIFPVLALAQTAAPAATEQRAAAEQPGVDGDIIVTAQRREQSIL